VFTFGSTFQVLRFGSDAPEGESAEPEHERRTDNAEA
jgi:hypothetical protein